MDAEQLTAAVLRVDERIGLELQWKSRGGDDDEPYVIMLALHVIVARPGEHHSQYSTIEITRFDAADLDQRRTVHRLAAAVAESTRLPLHTPPLETEFRTSGSAWIAAQPVGPLHSYEVAWKARWFEENGAPAQASGVANVPAISGREADRIFSREIPRRFSGRVLSVGTQIGSLRSGGGHMDNWPNILPSMERVREIAVTEGSRASCIARGLVARAPDATALDLMIAYHQAFYLAIDALVPLAAWRRGTVDDAALDAALPQIAENRESWSRPGRLREARAAGQSIAAFMRQEAYPGNFVRLTVDLMDTFGIPLGSAKTFVDNCRDPRNDAQLDEQLARDEGTRFKRR